MKSILYMTMLAAVVVTVTVSCSSNNPYRPASKFEAIEFPHDRLDVYPEDVRKDVERYSNLHVAWAGIIASNDAFEEPMGGRIRMDTVFQHHYFDWEQDQTPYGVQLVVSPRGEGMFRARWYVDRADPEATSADALTYAAPGQLAIVYGTPESVDDDGTIVLKYHYIRIVDTKHFNANELDYGRIGQPFHPITGKP